MKTKEQDDYIYSNFDHKLNTSIVKEMKQNMNKEYYHSAQNFCGKIYFDGSEFVEEVWRYGALIEVKKNKDIVELITETNSEYGME